MPARGSRLRGTYRAYERMTRHSSRAVLILALLVTRAPTISRGSQDISRRQYDAEILALIRQACRVLPLGTSVLSTLVPKCSAMTRKELPWEQAITYADSTFRDEPDRRAIFLSTYLRAGMPAARLAELNLSVRAFLMNGKCQSLTLLLKRQPPEPTSPGTRWRRRVWNAPRWTSMSFCVRTDTDDPVGKDGKWHGVLAGRGLLSLPNCTVKCIQYDVLTFDSGHRLYGWQRTVGPNDNGVVLVVGGNRSGKGGVDFYWAYVMTDTRRMLQIISLSPELEIRERKIRSPRPGEAVTPEAD